MKSIYKLNINTNNLWKYTQETKKCFSIDSDNAIKEKQVEQGFLGKIWGASSSIPNNIAALTIIVS